VLVAVIVGVCEGVNVIVGVGVGAWYVIHSCGRWLRVVASLLPNATSALTPEERSSRPLLLKVPFSQPCVTVVTSISRY